MSWIQWGDTYGENMLMARTKIQDHEDLLHGNSDARIEGIVPIVNRMVAQHDTFVKVAVLLNAVTLIGIAILGLVLHFK